MDTKFQKKHESDMTKKEKRELEREKLASMSKKQKLEYVVTYYKFSIIAAILIIFLIIGIVKWADDLKKETLLYVAAINSELDAGTIMDDFRKSIHDTDEYHEFVLDTSIFVGTGKEENADVPIDYNAQMKITTLVGAGTVDIYICPEVIYQNYAKEDGLLYEISDLMGEDFVKEHEAICLEDAIRIENSKVLQSSGITGTEPAYLVAFRYAKHPEIIKQFINYVVK